MGCGFLAASPKGPFVVLHPRESSEGFGFTAPEAVTHWIAERPEYFASAFAIDRGSRVAP